jgi:hypothetical protein
MLAAELMTVCQHTAPLVGPLCLSPHNARCARSVWDKARGAPLLPYALNLLLDVAHGVAYMHSHHILHGDLKPDNVLTKSSPEGLVAKVGAGGARARCSLRVGRYAHMMWHVLWEVWPPV